MIMDVTVLQRLNAQDLKGIAVWLLHSTYMYNDVRILSEKFS